MSLLIVLDESNTTLPLCWMVRSVCVLRGLGLWFLMPLIFQLKIVAISFIGGGNWSARRKPQTCHKSLTNLSHNVVSSTPRLRKIWTHNVSGDRHWLHRNSCKSNYHRITAMTAPVCWVIFIYILYKLHNSFGFLTSSHYVHTLVSINGKVNLPIDRNKCLCHYGRK